jgi:hypothetical protein
MGSLVCLNNCRSSLPFGYFIVEGVQLKSEHRKTACLAALHSLIHITFRKLELVLVLNLSHMMDFEGTKRRGSPIQNFLRQFSYGFFLIWVSTVKIYRNKVPLHTDEQICA